MVLRLDGLADMCGFVQHRYVYVCQALKVLGQHTVKLLVREYKNVSRYYEAGQAVFIITMQSGSVDFSLTAASHIFPREPCIDPSCEVQVAGHIPRLEQTKRRCVAKYYFPKFCKYRPC